MRIWYDALTGKHVRYGVAVANRLRREGHEVVMTTRKHPDTLPLANYLKESFITVGKFDPKTLLTRLTEGTRRQLRFCQIFKENSPDFAISHGSPDLCRVAFGLNKPVITTVDTPYADAVHRLTLPLSKHIVASDAIPARILQAYNTRAEYAGFDGVDEVAWIKDFKPRKQYDFGRPLIVVRPLEERAVYIEDTLNLLVLAKRLAQYGKVVYLSRYTRRSVDSLIIPTGFVDSARLVAQADLFIGVGGTITREAALQGTPAIVLKVFEEQYVNQFLSAKGFPIFETNSPNAFRLARKLLGKKYDVKQLLARLENPVDIIIRNVEKIHRT